MASVKQDKDIVVKIAENLKPVNVSLPRLRKLAETICKRFELSEATVSIALIDDTEIRKLNKQFLKCNRPTDCLSFDLSENNRCSSRSFELVVNAQKAVKEARLRGHSTEAELALYITHGLLHNLGFDDSTQYQAKKMHDMEDEILRQFGYGAVYNSKGAN